jgi:hypothetical protein
MPILQMKKIEVQEDKSVKENWDANQDHRAPPKLFPIGHTHVPKTEHPLVNTSLELLMVPSSPSQSHN